MEGESGSKCILSLEFLREIYYDNHNCCHKRMLMLLHIICAILTKDPWTAERHSAAESLHMRSTQMQKLLEIGRKGVMHLQQRHMKKVRDNMRAATGQSGRQHCQKAGGITDDGAFP